MTCGCHGKSGLGAVTLPSESIEVTAQAIPCTDLFKTYYASGSIFDGIQYNLCLAWHKMEDLAIAPFHWLRDLWNGMTTDFQSLIGSAKNMAGSAVETVTNAAHSLWNDTKDFLNYLDGQAANVLGWGQQTASSIGKWLLIAGGIFLAVELAPAINSTADAGNRAVRYYTTRRRKKR